MPLAEAYARRPWMRDGIAKTAEKTGARLASEDVWVRIANQSAYAHVIERDGQAIGFTILFSEQDPDGLVLFIWVPWNEPWGLRGSEHELYAELERIAKAIGAVRIRMQSPRKGYDKESFFERVASVYEHEVRC